MKKLGSNAVTTREKNIALIIKLINRNNRGSGGCSRAELAVQTGLTQASITYITKELIRWGLIRETGVLEGRTRHPSIGLAIDRENYGIIGVQINREYVRAGLFAIDGETLYTECETFPAPAEPGMVMERMYQCIGRILRRIPAGTTALAVGVALPGPFLPAKGKIELMTGAPGWSEIDIQGELAKRYALPVFLEHDANCGALAELWYGDTETQHNILYVNVANGIGAGLIFDGKLTRGQIGTAGEIGHMSLNFDGPPCECGNRGCLELYCSLGKLKSDYDALTGTSGKTAEEILLLAKNGDVPAENALEKSASYLGIGLANLVNILNPGTIILSDTFAAAGETLTKLVRWHMNRYLLHDIAECVEVRTASGPLEEITMRGASVAALEQLLKEPTKYFCGNSMK